MAAKLTPVTEHWGFTSRSTGWGLRLKQGDRIIAYLTPGAGRFRVRFEVRGDDDVRAAVELAVVKASN